MMSDVKTPLPAPDESGNRSDTYTSGAASSSGEKIQSHAMESPRVLIGIRASLITVMAGLLFISLFVISYSFWTLNRTRDTMATLVSGDLPRSLLVQILSDEISSLGDLLQKAHFSTSESDRRDRILDMLRQADNPRSRIIEMLKDTSRIPLSDEAVQSMIHMKQKLDKVDQELNLYDQTLAEIIAIKEKRNLVGFFLEQAFGSYDLALDDVSRQMRALVARALATDIPDASSTEDLHRRTDAFLEREMSWLGTTQDLRSTAREMTRIAEMMKQETESVGLDRLSQSISDGVLRMALYKRLPDTPVVQVLAGRTKDLVRQLSGTTEESLISIRKAELEMTKALALSFDRGEKGINDLREDSRNLIKMMGDQTEKTVQDTGRGVASSKKLLIGFAIIAGLVSIFAIRYFVLGRIVKRIEGLTGVMLRSAREALDGKETGFDSQMKMITHGGGRDEIAAMGESLLVFIEAIAQKDREKVLADQASREALRESEEKYRSVVERGNDGIAIIQDSKLQYANPKLTRMTGYTGAELMGTAFTAYITPEGLPGIIDIDSRREIYETAISHKDGNRIDVEINAGPITYEGKPAFLIFIRDITERKKLQIQLSHAQKLESIGQLAAGIAHEINTPTQYIGDNTRFLQNAYGDLNRILGKYKELLQATRAGKATDQLVREVETECIRADIDYLFEEVPKAIHGTLEGVGRVAEIVGAMKEFSHPGATEKMATDINKAVESTLTVARNEWKYVAEMVTDFDPSLPLVPCLPGEFNQVILNVVINAAHAIADVVGDGSTGKGTITVSTRRVEKYAEVCIADTGTGIKEEIRSRIFDPFFTTKEVGRGTGQGLAIARSVIVDKHGGTIDSETEVGKGTTFIIRLPIETEQGCDRQSV